MGEEKKRRKEKMRQSVSTLVGSDRVGSGSDIVLPNPIQSILDAVVEQKGFIPDSIKSYY